MREAPFLPQRRSVRLKHFDYASRASYFVTICTHEMKRLFGTVVGDTVTLNACGRIADRCWREIPLHFTNVELGAHVVMPNHVHGILRWGSLENDGELRAKEPRRAQHAVPLRPDGEARRFREMVATSIPVIVRSFKSAAAARIRATLGKPDLVVWQRGYYEHVIRDDDDFRNASAYIRTNPARWRFDKDNIRGPGFSS